MLLRYKKLHEDAREPVYSTPGAAGFDLHAVEGGRVLAGDIARIPLGIAVEVPPGCALLLTARSGHGVRHGAGVPHGYGLIDSDYRGELFMVLTTQRPLTWFKGDRIGQGIIVPVYTATFAETAELSDTQRGAGGFGSTGV